MDRQMLVPVAWLAGAAGILLGGATLVCAGGPFRVPWIDAAGLAWLSAWRTSGLDIFFAAITWLGSLWVLLPLAVLMAWRESKRSSLPASIFVPVSLLVAAGLAHIAKIIVERPRPDLFPATVLLPADWSFPSAHAMQATAFFLAMLLQPKGGCLLAKAVGATVIILLVGVSRVYLQVHFPTDVVFGIVAAIGCVFAVRKLIFEQRSLP
jgi:undecaprenyl-diphosphatase